MAVHARRPLWLTTLSLAILLGLLSACSSAPTPEPKAAAPAATAKPAAAEATKAPAAAPTTAPAPTKAAGVVAPAGKKELIVIQSSDIESLNPHMTTHAPDIVVAYNIFDNLVDRNSDNKLVPALATEWKTLNDTTWQFKLRQGVKFTNGEPFNAKTVQFSLGRVAKNLPTYDAKAVVMAGYFTTIKSIDVVDDYTVNIVTSVVDPLIPERLSFYGGQMLPPEYYVKLGNEEFGRKPVGTGPLKFVEWVKDDRAVLEANKEWWGGQIDFEKVTFKPRPEVAPRVAAVLKGEADIITKLPPDQVDQVNKNATTQAIGVPYAGEYVIASMYKSPYPLNNKYFMQAMSYAVDRKAIVNDLWRGQGAIPNGIYPQNNFSYDASLPQLEFNPAKAKQLLQQAGYKGEEVIFECTDGYLTNDKPMAEAVASMFKDVGINLKIEMIEYSVRAQRGRDMNFKGLWWMDPTDVYQEADGMIYRHQGVGGKHRFEGQGLWTDPNWDKLMQEARSTIDPVKRNQLYQQAQKIWLDWMPWVPVIQPNLGYGIQKFIDWKPMANEDFRIQDVKLRK